MAELLERYGTISWADALGPAVRVSEAGFLVTPELWRLWNAPSSLGITSFSERLRVTEECRRIYYKPDGTTYHYGERFHNPDHARTLARLADAGPDDFYRGALARDMAADLEANGALVTAEDLAGYKVLVGEPLEIDYRGYHVATNQPAGGGVCLAQILKILAREDIAAMELNSVDYIDFVAHAMKAGYHDWYGYVGDPAFADVPLAMLLSDARAADWHRRIRAEEHFTVPMSPESPHTTNVTVVDGAGNCIALTHSLSSSSGVVTPGIGFTWNNIMNAADPMPGRPNSIAPGKRRMTGMCPTIVSCDGEPVLVLGAPGGTRIITGVLQVILNILDHGLSPVEAVSAPRFDCQSEKLDCEARVPSWVRTEVAKRGFDLVNNPATYGSFALVQAITRDPASGALRGGADPRSGGAVMSV
jgi:gamma-glutamyltranspeptidase/glutathione hydrolase